MSVQPFASADLDACIACGYCLPACPTYRLTGDEASSPRGRLSLMSAIQTGEVDINDPVAVEQSEQCLGCRACEPVCPAGVQYGRLIEQWRDAAWDRKPLKLRGLMAVVAVPFPLRIAGRLRGAARTTRGSEGVNLMLGCFERVLYPQVSRAVAELYPQVKVVGGQGCCGALHAHNGELAEGDRMAEVLGDQLGGVILTTSGGCAAHLASVLGRHRVVELSEYVVQNPPGPLSLLYRDGRVARIGIQDSCHLRNGLGVGDTIRDIVRQIGALVELPSASDCCGAAGSYSVLRPSDASAVFEVKHHDIEQGDVDVMVVVNPGCYRQVATEMKRRRTPIEVRHLVELVSEASR